MSTIQTLRSILRMNRAEFADLTGIRNSRQINCELHTERQAGNNYTEEEMQTALVAARQELRRMESSIDQTARQFTQQQIRQRVPDRGSRIGRRSESAAE